MSFSFNNQHYKSIDEFATQYQITKTSAINLLLSNATFNTKNVNVQLKNIQEAQQLKINGIIYKSLQEAADKHHMSVSQLEYNVSVFGYKTDLVFNTHISEQIMSHYRLNNYYCPITINNIKFKSLYEACNYAKLTKKRLLDNIKQVGTNSAHVFDMNNNDSQYKVELDNLVFKSKTQMREILWLYGLPTNFNYLLNHDPNVLIDPNRLVDANSIATHIPCYLVDSFNKVINTQIVTFVQGQALVKLKPILQFYHNADFLK